MQSKSLTNAYEPEESTGKSLAENKEDGNVGIARLRSLLLENRLINRIVLAVTSLILLLLALFAPMVNSKSVINEGRAAKIDFTVADSVKLVVYSVLPFSDAEISRTDEYIAYENYVSRLEEGKVSYIDNKKTSEALKNYLFLSVMEGSFSPKISMTVSAIAMVIYLVLCFILFIRSCSELLLEWLFAKKRKNTNVRNLIACTNIVWLIALLLPLLSYLLLQMCNFGVGEKFNVFSSGGVGLGYGIILSFTVVLIASAWLLISYSMQNIFPVKKREKIGSKKNITVFISAFLAAVSFLLPCMSVDFAKKTASGAANTSASFNINDVYEFMSNDVSYYMRLSGKSGQSPVHDVVEEAFSDYDDEGRLAFDSLNRVLLGYSKNDISIVYIILYFVCAAMLLSVAFVVLSILKRVFFDHQPGRALRFYAILQFALSILYIGLMIFLSYVANMSFPMVAKVDIAFGVGVGPVIALISSTAILMTVRGNHNVYADMGYDNADTSFAPYVVGYRKSNF